MDGWFGRTPVASVVIPTYNQSDLLRGTLLNLTRQEQPPGSFEVVVADDGSDDDTRSVVDAFRDRLRLRYVFQEDLGFRAGSARNAGARVATADLLVFLDTGSMVGPSFLSDHLAPHTRSAERLGVIGVSYGYNPEDPIDGLDPALLEGAPEVLVARHGSDPRFQDIREPEFARSGHDLAERVVPWMLFWTGNCSIHADDFWAVGGFDEDFTGWGGEDMDLGRRLVRSGLALELSPEAWAVVAPHDRDIDANDQSLIVNLTRMLRKAPELDVEIGWGVVATLLIMPWEDESRRLREWIAACSTDNVAHELADLLGGWGPGDRVAVLGCGTRLPDVPDGVELVLVDFDERVLSKLETDVAHTRHVAIGLRTPLPAGAVDGVVATSRLLGLWDTWGEVLEQEASRLCGSGLQRSF